MEMIVARAGFLTSVQDLGRTDFREFGVSTSGALDPFGMRVANLLVGNDEGAAGLVIPLGPRPGSPISATRISSWTAPHDWVSPARPNPILRFVRGMDWTRFNASSLQRLTSEPFTVSPDSDRMGVRLTGPELSRAAN